MWKEIANTLQEPCLAPEIIDDDMMKLFVFSLKDLTKYLVCFEGAEKTRYYLSVSEALSRDAKMFSKHQVYSIPDYKISIDWVSRNINKLLYISCTELPTTAGFLSLTSTSSVNPFSLDSSAL